MAAAEPAFVSRAAVSLCSKRRTCTRKSMESLGNHNKLVFYSRIQASHSMDDKEQVYKKLGEPTRNEEMDSWKENRRIRKVRIQAKGTNAKAKFLEDLGYGEDSTKMQKAMKFLRGRGTELSERFDCLVEAGLDRKDVCEMIKVSPQILNQSKNVLQMKIDFLVNQLGYPASTLVAFPSYLTYNRQTVKFRLAVYQRLKGQGTGGRKLALSTVLACSDKYCFSQYVKHHPRGLEVWNDLKKTYSN